MSVPGRVLKLSGIGPQWRSLRTLTPTSTAPIKIGLLDMFIGWGASDEAILVPVEPLNSPIRPPKGFL